MTLYFTLPPLVAATVSESGVQALTPGYFRVRIGDVPGPHPAAVDAPGLRWVEGTVGILGAAPVVVV